MASEAFGRGQGQVVSDRGDVDAVVDCLLNGVQRLRLCLANSSFWLGRHALIVATPAGDINQQTHKGR